MQLFIDCVLIVVGLGYFYGGLIFAVNFALDLGKKGFVHFKDFIGESIANVFILLLFVPWLAIAVFAYLGATFIFFLKGESMN